MPLLKLTKLGGARAILATVAKAPKHVVRYRGLGPNENCWWWERTWKTSAAAIKILFARNSNSRFGNSGSSIDSEDTLRFAEYSGVRPMIEKYPLEKAGEAYAPHDERQSRIPRRPDDVRRSRSRNRAARRVHGSGAHSVKRKTV